MILLCNSLGSFNDEQDYEEMFTIRMDRQNLYWIRSVTDDTTKQAL